MTAPAMAALDGKKYLNLETYRKTGLGVRTPVWFVMDPTSSAPAAKLFVYTLADSGKAKRIRRNNVVKVAPCDARGKVSGEWIDARAIITGPEEFERAMKLLNEKYRPWKQILDLSVRLLRPRERVVLAISPA